MLSCLGFSAARDARLTVWRPPTCLTNGLTYLMGYEPQFTIGSTLLSLVEEIAVLRERIDRAAVDVSCVPALQKDSRARNVHASTAIEG